MRPATLFVLTLLGGAGLTGAASAQEPSPNETTATLHVFLDCNARNCDFDHFRRQIAWVNWVRDRQDAELHLLITDESTGGGGLRYTLDYLGRGVLAGTSKSLLYVSDPDETDAEVREGLTQTMALGLVEFVETTPLAARLRVVYDEPDTVLVDRDQDDPWNLWVFRVGLEGSIDGEAQERGYSLEGSARADRVSENVKINISVSGEYDREEFDELDEGETFVNVSENYSVNLLTVWSVSDHFSLGGTGEVEKSTFLNRELAVFVGPALEYNFFPYRESTRRSVTARYSIELAAFRYELETVEGETEEILPRHNLLIAAAVQQPWGEIFGSVDLIQYLHDFSTHRINTFVNIEYRLFRGFNLDISGSFSRIKDQFFLPAEDLSPEEILLRRRQRETNYRFDFGVGFSYRFGSKFANIVNPRMNRSRRRR